jgi:hypothetical protein
MSNCHNSDVIYSVLNDFSLKKNVVFLTNKKI